MSNSIMTHFSILILAIFCFTNVPAQQTLGQLTPLTASDHCARVRTRISALQSNQTSVGNFLKPQPSPSPTPSIDEQIKEMDEQIKLLAKKKELETAQKALRDAVAANSDPSDVEKQTDLLTKKKAEVDAQKALLQSIFPSGTPKTMEGKIEGSDKLTLENQIIAYEAVDNITNGIGKEVLDAIPDPGNSRIIIHNAADLNYIVQYITLMNQLKQAIKVYDELLKERIVLPGESGSSDLASALMAPQLASSVLSSVIDLISMFRTDTEYKATTVNIDNQALIGQVAKSLLAQKKNIQIYYPEIVPSNILFMEDGDTLEIIEQLNKLLEKKEPRRPESSRMGIFAFIVRPLPICRSKIDRLLITVRRRLTYVYRGLTYV